MVVMVLYGWHGIPNLDGTLSWIHLPDESYKNQWGVDGLAYDGRIHRNVDNIETKTTTTINGEVKFEHSGSVQVCHNCGADSRKDWA